MRSFVIVREAGRVTLQMPSSPQAQEDLLHEKSGEEEKVGPGPAGGACFWATCVRCVSHLYRAQEADSLTCRDLHL